jgi:hypothetical protein
MTMNTDEVQGIPSSCGKIQIVGCLGRSVRSSYETSCFKDVSKQTMQESITATNNVNMKSLTHRYFSMMLQ